MLHILLFMVEMQQTLVEVSQILHQGNLKKKRFWGMELERKEHKYIMYNGKFEGEVNLHFQIKAGFAIRTHWTKI